MDYAKILEAIDIFTRRFKVSVIELHLPTSHLFFMIYEYKYKEGGNLYIKGVIISEVDMQEALILSEDRMESYITKINSRTVYKKEYHKDILCTIHLKD